MATKRTGRGLRRDRATGIWHIDVSIKGRRIQCSAGTTSREEAQEKRDHIRAQLWREAHLGERPEVTWDQAILEWFAVKERDGKRSIEDDRDKARFFHDALRGRPLRTITGEEIEARMRSRTSWSNATWNRHRAFVLGVLNFARKKGWLETAPSVTRFTEDDERDPPVCLTRCEALRLLVELPPHLYWMALFSLETGLRQANVCYLRWSWVDPTARTVTIPRAELKQKRDFVVHLSQRAAAVIERQRGRHPEYVFVYGRRGRLKPIAAPRNHAWEKACHRAELPGTPWKALRSTWASWHLMAGTPIEVVQRLGGWARIDVLLKHYARFLPSYLAGWADNAGSRGEPLRVAA